MHNYHTHTHRCGHAAGIQDCLDLAARYHLPIVETFDIPPKS